ncbi:MAG: hypothetical protein ACLP1X_12930, partial [Polyangiaceae bacterium]
GTQTYTWRTTPAVIYDVKIGATTTLCAGNLASVLMGTDTLVSPVNLVLREVQDVLWGEFTYDGSLTNLVIVASYATYTLSATGAAVSVVAVVGASGPTQAINVDNTQFTNIIGNTVKDMYDGIVLTGCIGAKLSGNQMIGSAIQRLHNLYTTFGPDNAFYYTPWYDFDEGRPWRFMPNSDGFSVDHLCPGAINFQQFQDPTGAGKRGLVPIGNGSSTGQAQVKLWYGTELVNGYTPQSLGWSWANGETVEFSNGGTTHTFTFQRTSPGAGQFNSATSLLALINATSDLTAAFAPYTNTGGDLNPDQMIVVTVVTGGAAGNSWFCQVNTQLSANLRSQRTVGVVLVNRQGAVAGLKCFFLGGAAAGYTTTPVFTPLASTAASISVTGYDATSQALAPAVYEANVVPGVGFTITHSAGAGTEQFFFSIN